MTQKEQLLYLFREHQNKLTLGQILNTTLAAAYRGRMSDLRNDGYVINLELGNNPSENLYTLVEKKEERKPIYPPDEYGQMMLGL